jgi:hypothetical protein
VGIPEDILAADEEDSPVDSHFHYLCLPLSQPLNRIRADRKTRGPFMRKPTGSSRK